jgi:hypothetical protein
LRPLDGRQVSCHLAERFLEPGRPEPGDTVRHAPQPHS